MCIFVKELLFFSYFCNSLIVFQLSLRADRGDCPVCYAKGGQEEERGANIW